jgi:hypothetical protein
VRVLGGAEVGDRGPRQQERPADLDLLHQVELLHRQIGRRGEVDRRGIVDHDVDPAEPVDALAHGALNVLLGADVADHRQRLPARGFDLRRGGVDRALEPRMGLVGLGQQHDVCAVVGGTDRDRQSDAAAPARHQDRPPGQRLLGGSHAGGQHGRAVRGMVRSWRPPAPVPPRSAPGR